MKRILLFMAVVMMAAINVVAQERVQAGLDSTVIYNRNENGQEFASRVTVYYRNEAGQLDSALTYNAEGILDGRTLYLYEDVNNDGTIDEIQDNYTYWNEVWSGPFRNVMLTFDSPMDMEEQEWSWNNETSAWEIAQAYHVHLSNEGKTYEAIRYWYDSDSQQLYPQQKQVVTLETSFLNVVAANPDKSLQMLAHHVESNYLLKEIYYYDESRNEWDIEQHEARTCDENGVELSYEYMYYSYNTETNSVEITHGNKTIYTPAENGGRYDIYSFYNGEWQLNGYRTVTKAGNRVTINQYRVDNGEGILHMQDVQTLDAEGKVIESTNFSVMNGSTMTSPSSRYTNTYDEQGRLIAQKWYAYVREAWELNSINLSEYDKAGRLVSSANATVDYDNSNAWSYGNKYSTKYSADGKLLMRASYFIDNTVPVSDEIAWLLEEKSCFYFHHDEAVAVTTETVEVAPAETTAQFTWPYVENAYIYNIFVYMHGSLYHHYMFDADGHLMSIRYAPAQGEAIFNRLPQYASATTNGWQFTIQDLEMGEEYTYTFTAEAEDGTELQNITGSFVTQAATGILTIETIADGIRYNLMGQQVGKDYKGIVIMNGKKYIIK